MMTSGRRRPVRRAPVQRARRPDAASPWPFVGIGAMVSVGFLYGASALVAPWWAVTLLAVVWLVGFVLCCAWWTPHPRRLVWVAGIATVLWFVTLVGGARFLGWGG